MEPTGELYFRSSTVADVSFPNRTIELIVAPYEEEALVDRKGVLVKETIAAGAFDGIQRRVSRIKVNREHDVHKVVGRAVAIHPSRKEGLIAELRISNTDLGTETLELANDGVLDASAGFLPLPDGEKWETRSSVRVTKAWLGHVAMVAEPAYEGARVLAVRHKTDGTAATPNLDQVKAMLAEERYRQLERQIG
jgi:HK97 family phage prohead protease